MQCTLREFIQNSSLMNLFVFCYGRASEILISCFFRLELISERATHTFTHITITSICLRLPKCLIMVRADGSPVFPRLQHICGQIGTSVKWSVAGPHQRPSVPQSKSIENNSQISINCHTTNQLDFNHNHKHGLSHCKSTGSNQYKYVSPRMIGGAVSRRLPYT